jgi:hypothetical protein
MACGLLPGAGDPVTLKKLARLSSGVVIFCLRPSANNCGKVCHELNTLELAHQVAATIGLGTDNS